MSERRVCHLVGADRTMICYRRQDQGDEALRGSPVANPAPKRKTKRQSPVSNRSTAGVTAAYDGSSGMSVLLAGLRPGDTFFQLQVFDKFSGRLDTPPTTLTAKCELSLKANAALFY